MMSGGGRGFARTGGAPEGSHEPGGHLGGVRSTPGFVARSFRFVLESECPSIFTRLHVYGISNVDLQLHITASIHNTPQADLSFRYEVGRATGGVSEERRDRAVFFKRNREVADGQHKQEKRIYCRIVIFWSCAGT